MPPKRTPKRIETLTSQAPQHKGKPVNYQEISELRKKPPNDFRDIPIFPSTEELVDADPSKFGAEEFLRRNVITTPYPDVDTYLDIHFRLIRKDFMDTLKSTIGKFCKGSKQDPDITQDNKLQFYRNVTFTPNSFLRQSTVAERPSLWRRYYVSFEAPGKIDWENEKRLMSGSLICLWNAQFKLIILGTVTDSDVLELEKGKVGLALHEPLPSQVNWKSFTYTMLECPVFYEPYRAVMEAYQKLNDHNLPLKDYILGRTKEPGRPDYLQTKKALKSDYVLQLANGQYQAVEAIENFSFWPSSEQLGLNAVQRKALYAALTRKVALIQGPPGTGKSFLGRKIISALLDNQHLWHDDGNFEEDNRRLTRGFAPHAMSKFWNTYGDQWNDQRCPIVVICFTNLALDQFLEGILKRTNRIVRVGGQSKSAVLEPYQLRVIKQSARERANEYNETNFLYYQHQMNHLRKIYADIAETIALETKRGINSKRLNNLKEQLKEIIVQYNDLVRPAADVAICRNAHVIGMTTTGAARRRKFLETLKPKIVIVEEAAQVFEAHIVASLTTSCEHLIMIGDHKQLQPACSVYELAFKYRLNVSLFERLARSGFPSVMLDVQHRMQPDIARLIVPVVYRDLKNHPSVHNYPPVPSVSHGVFLIDHREPEQREPGGSSYFNPHEAHMALRLARFLVDQGVKAEKITVLAAYAAQTREMLRHRAKYYTLKSLDNVLITTIDNYQGEENDVVILSLVRSNTNKSAGFLTTPNRVNVALSRARHGLYILANLELLCHSNNQLWVHVKRTLQKSGQMGDALTLMCDRHPNGEATRVSRAEDFPIGGLVCKFPCGHPLECGHPCKLPCRKECQHNYPFCEAKLKVNLPCGHVVTKDCSVKKERLGDFTCTFECSRKLSCGHSCRLKCAEECSSARCTVPVVLSPHLFPRTCNHRAQGPCYLNCRDGPFLPESSMLRNCAMPCQKRLNCGHLCKLKCYQDCNSAVCRELVMGQLCFVIRARESGAAHSAANTFSSYHTARQEFRHPTPDEGLCNWILVSKNTPPSFGNQTDKSKNKESCTIL